MPQKLRDDKIGALSQSSGIITMAASTASPSWLTIGGQQYKVTSNLTRTISTDVTMTNSNIYMLYAVVSSGVVDLRISANVNSVGPSGFLGWKLIGAFHATGSLFGGFARIDQAPKTDWINFPSLAAGTLITGTAGNPTYGTLANHQARWRRDGQEMFIEWDYAQTTAGSGSGASITLFNLPAGPQIDTTQKPANNTGTAVAGAYMNSGVGTFNNAFVGNGGEIGAGPVVPYSATQLKFAYVYGGTTVSRVTGFDCSIFTLASPYHLQVRANFPIVGWSNTALKDL